MTTSASQSGFTDVTNNVNDMFVSGATWSFAGFDDCTAKTITFDLGGWFDGSKLARLVTHVSLWEVAYAGLYAVRVSADAINWYNIPNAYIMLGGQVTGSNGGTNTSDFTALSDTYNYRYIQLYGVSGGVTKATPGSGESGYYPPRIDKMAWQTSGGAALTVDTSGGSNPNPNPNTADGTPVAPTPGTTQSDAAFAGAIVARLDDSTSDAAFSGAIVARLDDSTSDAVFVGAIVAYVPAIRKPHSFGVFIG